MGEQILTEGRLLEAAGDVIFGRGEDYVRYVHGLRVVGARAQASIQARNVYVVELDWSSRDLKADCNCPHFDKGFFCKHLVALGLAAIDGQNTRYIEIGDAVDVADLHTYLDGLNGDQLKDLIVEISAKEESVDKLLRVRAAVSGASGPGPAKALAHGVTTALNVRGFIDYRRSFDVARSASELLDELESYFDSGAAEIIRPALLKALTRLRSISQQADDSSGSIGDSCQRAADMYARACREGSPDPITLARWLAKFREESPGWPETTLNDFVDAFDERGLRSYRKAVEKLSEKYAGVHTLKRSEVDRMLLELADHDGDVDRAIAVLADGEHVEFGGIVDRLRAAGRDAEVLVWSDRAVAAGKISRSQGKGSYWLDPGEVADCYVGAGRPEDAIELLRNNFARSPGLPSYRLLLHFAEPLGIGGVEREGALVKARELAREFTYSNGAFLVELALSEGDLAAAWDAAEQFGPGHLWRQLGAASEAERPRQAADLHLRELDAKLKHPNSPVYPEIAATLAKMKMLYDRAGDTADFAALMSRVRNDFGRRPALMTALDKRGL